MILAVKQTRRRLPRWPVTEAVVTSASTTASAKPQDARRIAGQRAAYNDPGGRAGLAWTARTRRQKVAVYDLGGGT